MTLGIVLDVNRASPTRAGHPVALVNVGRLPPETAAAANTTGRTAARHPPPRAPLRHGSRLRLARLGLDAPITDVTAPGNVMQIPRDPHTVGWWTGGSAPGDTAGTTVLVGHINYAGTTGALAVLAHARPGDALVVREDHHDRQYRVVAIRSYPKSVGIPVRIFSRTGPARLVLITCGGPFDRATGNYDDNIVAYAEPA